MAEDPYHAFRSELQQSLSQASQLHASLVRIRSTVGANGRSEELREVGDELRGTLAALEADLEELEESVRVVEQTGPRLFNIEERELGVRRAYVRDVRKEIENMRADLAVSGGAGSSRPSRPPSYTTQAPQDEDDQAAWAQEEQQMLVEQQDTTLHAISGTLSTLAEQAGLIGREVGEHNEMLGDIERGVDRTDIKLASAMDKMKKFIRQTEETKSGWCVGILIVVLCALLLAVVLV